jgi:hypothetical protein
MLHRVASSLLLLSLLGSPAQAPPAPPYGTIEGNTFEPSAIAYDPNQECLLVLNDKDSIVYRYDASKIMVGMTKLSGGPHSALKVPRRPSEKFESLTRLPDGRFLAATAFDRAESEFGRIIRFSFTSQGVSGEELIQTHGLRKAILSRDSKKRSSAKIEGLAVNAKGDRIFIGVRQLYNYNPREKRTEDPEDVILIFRCPFDREGIVGEPEAMFDLTMSADGDSPSMGLSDIQRDPSDGSYLILTSHEDDKNQRTSHSGAIFRVKGEVLEGKSLESTRHPELLGQSLKEFQAKSEGVAILPGKRYFVVFDDDVEWKKLFKDYQQSQGLFDVFEQK